MAIFSSSDAKVLLPRQVGEGLIKETLASSTLARLSGARPMLYGNVDYFTFNAPPRAEFVEEGADKSSTTGKFGSVTAAPHKAQVTMRFNEEVLFADEDYQLSVLSTLADAGATALSRALDLGAYHRINPLTGAAIENWTEYITATTNTVTLTDGVDPDDALDAAIDTLVDGRDSFPVTGAAFDPRFARSLATLKIKAGDQPTSQRRYPELGFGNNIESFGGLTVAQGSTVSATPEAADTKVRAIVGDFTDGVRWGIQRDMPIELIRFGDPDGQGDLKRKNQVALRLEVVYGWWVDKAKFAIVKAA
ncbi:phage major capsid protein [Schaalia sp. ZJ405]|uniref:phage major capsid protein n=1 Tax=Schaalia sp. ZJ405 TaxID=2709403 RepID=UPI0013E9D86E|nr:phage major capsid protein [Schaalia sp. ZJ405]QPK80814.1 phage major capsid protein [Schaalia sp. ZJ405]